MKHTDKLIFAGIGACIGSVGAYIFAYKTLSRKFKKIADAEVADVKAHYSAKQAKDEIHIPEEDKTPTEQETEVLVAYSDIVEELYTDIKGPKGDTGPAPDSQNTPPVHTDRPYVVSFQSFMDDFDTHEKITLTFYNGDDVLCDERDELVPDISGLLGTGWDEWWGYGGGGTDVVYVRNPNISVDFEVLRHAGSYSVEVLGMTKDEG